MTLTFELDLDSIKLNSCVK